MYEKILQKLKIQRGETSNVSDRSLEDLAKSLATIISADEILEKADLSAAIKSIDGNINSYTKKQIELAKKAESEKTAAEKAAEEKKKAEEDALKAKNDKDVPQYIKDMMEQQKKTQEMLLALQSEKSANTRKTLLEKTLETTPDFYKKSIVSAFEKTSFENEESFTEFLGTVKSNAEAFTQAAKEHGLPVNIPAGGIPKPEETGETPTLKSAREVLNAEKEKLKT